MTTPPAPCQKRYYRRWIMADESLAEYAEGSNDEQSGESKDS